MRTRLRFQAVILDTGSIRRKTRIVEDLASSQYDAVIIGAGIAGALIAWQLSEAGFRVVLLEAGERGPDRVDLVGNYAAAANKTPGSPYERDKSKAPWPDGETDYYVQNADATAPRFKSTYLRRVGGTTWHFLGNVPRFVPSDFRLHSLYDVGVDWPISYADLEPWYCMAEREMGVSGDHDEWQNLLGAFRSQPYPMSKIWSSYSDLIVEKAIDGLKFEDVVLKLMSTPQARNSQPYQDRPVCAGNSTCVPLCPIGAKYDATVHVRRAIGFGAELREETIATRLEADATRRIRSVHYVRWDGSIGVTSGRIVVLAAHAVESPKLLLLSKGEHAPEMGIANSSDQAGRNLMDHLQGQAGALLPDPVFPFRGPPTTSGIDVFRDGAFRSGRAAFRMSMGNDAWGRLETPHDTLLKLIKEDHLFGSELRQNFVERVIRQFRISYSSEMLPRAENRVTLATETSEFGIPRPKLTMQLDDYNRLAFVKAQEVMAFIFRALGATEVKFPDPNKYSGAGHIMGTCRMGDAPKEAVVDCECRSHDHPNLFIVGASVFPTSGTANPTLTAAALALRAAKTIIAQLRS
jgi:choline dehydrogenase-like flavoprotein